MIKHFNITVYKHNLELIVDLEREHWYLLFPKYGQYASGEVGRGHFERNYNCVRIGRRDYELVIDCDDDMTQWESVSIFDVNKQDYLKESYRLDK